MDINTSMDIKIYSYNKEEAGLLLSREDSIEVRLNGCEPILIPRKDVRSATSSRIGKVAQSIYALKIFLNLPASLSLKKSIKDLKVKVRGGKELPASALCNLTGEYVEFFINPVDVLGYDLKEKPKARQIIDSINGAGTI